MKIIQFGDLHLDIPFEKLSRHAARACREISRSQISEIVALAERETADAIVCTGDLFDSPTPYLDSCISAALAFGKTKIPVFIAPGNHDPYTGPASPYEAVDWPENVHIFKSTAPETVELPCGRITGWANTEKRQHFRPLAQKPDLPADGSPDIFVFHGEIAADSSYFCADGGEIEACGADYLALGHIHGYFQKQFGPTLAVMNGGVQACRQGETGQKGAVVAEISMGQAKARLVPVEGLRAVEFECPDEAAADILEELKTQLDPEMSFCEISLLGRPTCDLSRIKALGREFLSFKLNDLRVSPPATRNGRSLAARFARAGAEEGISPLALEFGLAALENREAPR